MPVVDFRRSSQVVGPVHHRDITAAYDRGALSFKAREEAASDAAD